MGVPKRAAIYIRVSTELQEDNSSLGTQEAECRRYATERGYEVARVYRDVHSGFELYERPQVSAMREVIRRGEIDAVIAYALDRLGRKQAHIAILAEECSRADVDMLFVTEEFEKSAIGEFIRAAKAFAAETEREKFKERSARALKARRDAGKRIVGCSPRYGYDWHGEDKATYAPNPETAPVVQRIFRDIAAGISLNRLGAMLGEEGVRRPKGGTGHWIHTTLRSMILCPAYAGDEVGCPALIDRETAAVARAVMERNRSQSARNNRDPEAYLLRAGHVVCGSCGHTAISTWVKRRDGVIYPTYQIVPNPRHHPDCPQVSIASRGLDAAVWEYIVSIVMRPDMALQRATEPVDDDSTKYELEAIDKALTTLARKQSALMRVAESVDDDDAADEIATRIGTLGAEKRALQRERAAILARQQATEATKAQQAAFVTWCKSIQEKLVAPSADLDSQEMAAFGRLLESERHNLLNAPYTMKRSILASFNVVVAIHPTSHSPRYDIYASLRITPELTAYYVNGSAHPAILDNDGNVVAAHINTAPDVNVPPGAFVVNTRTDSPHPAPPPHRPSA